MVGPSDEIVAMVIKWLVWLVIALLVVVEFQMAVCSLSSELRNPVETCSVGLALMRRLWPSQSAWEVVTAVIPFPHPATVVPSHLIVLGCP